MKITHLRLYVTGRTPSAERAISTLRALQAELGETQLAIEIIDVLDDPVTALNDDVYATPTVFRISPDPVKRLFGDLSRKDVLITELGLR